MTNKQRTSQPKLTREQSKRVKSYIEDSGMSRAEAVAMVRFEDGQ